MALAQTLGLDKVEFSLEKETLIYFGIMLIICFIVFAVLFHAIGRAINK